MLDVIDVRAGYGRLPVLFDVSFGISPGELVAILGPNGAGKSTTLKTILGLVRPTRGAVVFDGCRSPPSRPAPGSPGASPSRPKGVASSATSP